MSFLWVEVFYAHFRCVQVNLPAEGRDDPAAWPEVVNKIKESVVLAFDAAIVEREEEVKRGEAQRMMVGWNFCTWFLLKVSQLIHNAPWLQGEQADEQESLAHSFEAVGLPSDALVIYEELEATFFQILKEQNLSWFGKLGATSPNDDSLPVLDVRSKPYREMLQGSAISIFDFRVYVFARQAKLLGQLGRITEVAKRGQWFVASLTRRLRESEVSTLPASIRCLANASRRISRNTSSRAGHIPLAWTLFRDATSGHV